MQCSPLTVVTLMSCLTRVLLFYVLFSLLTGCTTLAERKPRPPAWAQPVAAASIPNLYRLDTRLYRSAQPGKNSLHSLENLGIKTVLNLRYTQTDHGLIPNQALTLLHLPMLAHDVTPDELRTAVNRIVQAEPPVLVHCLHGSDRTGAVMAAYRILQQGWTVDAALDELQYGGYGYHYWLFPNLIDSVSALATPSRSKVQPAERAAPSVAPPSLPGQSQLKPHCAGLQALRHKTYQRRHRHAMANRCNTEAEWPVARSQGAPQRLWPGSATLGEGQAVSGDQRRYSGRFERSVCGVTMDCLCTRWGTLEN